MNDSPVLELLSIHIVKITWFDNNVTKCRLFKLSDIEYVEMEYSNDTSCPFIVTLCHRSNETKFKFWSKANADMFMLRVFTMI